MLGARTANQLEQLLGYLDLTLDSDQLQRLDELSAPAPIMPREGLDLPAVDDYFHAGIRNTVKAPSLATHPSPTRPQEPQPTTPQRSSQNQRTSCG
jgi:hypothetical protein